MHFVFILFCAVFVLNLIYRRFVDPFQLFMIFGKKGSGKSSFLAKKALFYLKKGWIVYTNMEELHIPGVRLIDATCLGDYVPEHHSVLLLDEVGMLYDNRNFKSFKESTRDFFKLQRHYKCIVYLASQSFDVDKKLRDLTDGMMLCTKVFPWLGLIRPISKKVGLVEASAQGESRIVDNLRFRWIFSWRFIFLPRFAKCFDSFSLPVRPLLNYNLVSDGSSQLDGANAEHPVRAPVPRLIVKLGRRRRRSRDEP